MSVFKGSSGFYINDSTTSGVPTAITRVAGAVALAGTIAEGVNTPFLDMPTNCDITAVEVLAVLTDTDVVDPGSSVIVDLFRGPSGEFPLISAIELDGPLQETTNQNISAYKTLDPPRRWQTQNIYTWVPFPQKEGRFVPQVASGTNMTNAIYGRVTITAGSAAQAIILIVHWEQFR